MLTPDTIDTPKFEILENTLEKAYCQPASFVLLLNFAEIRTKSVTVVHVYSW